MCQVLVNNVEMNISTVSLCINLIEILGKKSIVYKSIVKSLWKDVDEEEQFLKCHYVFKVFLVA